MSQTSRRTGGAAAGASGTRSGLPIGPDVVPLRLLALILGLVVVAFGVYVIVSAIQGGPDDSTPRTAAERALIDARGAIEADPRDIDARVTLARVYIGMGQYESAKRALEAGEELDPDNLAIVHLLGLAYLESGDAASSLVHLERASVLEGGFAEDYVGIWADIARARIVQGDLEAAAQAYRQALVYAPQAADIIFDLAQVYERQGETDEAIRAYEGVTQFIPDHPGALEALERLRPTDR